MSQPLTHVSPGEPFKPSANAWNAFIDTARTVRDARSIFRPGPLLPPDPAQDSCDCCPECCATLWYVVGDQILWEADHFAGETEANLALFGTSGMAEFANSCDVDNSGNVYQGGPPSALLQTDLSLPQAPMYTLRSYTSNGDLRWSWSPYPSGYVSGSNRAKPNGIGKVRCGGNKVFTTEVIAGGGGGTLDLICRRFDSDGTLVWTKTITSGGSTPPGGHDEYWGLVGATDSVIIFTTSTGALGGVETNMAWDHSGNFVWAFNSNNGGGAWVNGESGTDLYYVLGNDSAVSRYVASTGVFQDYASASGASAPTFVRALGNTMAASTGAVIREYNTVGSSNSPTNTLSTTEDVVLITSDTVGTRDDGAGRLRNLDLSTRTAFWGLKPADGQAITDAMPTSSGSVWCGRRRCGVTLIPESTTPTTTTTGSTTTTTTGSTTTTTTTATGSTTTGSTTTTTTTGSTTTTTTGSTTTTTTTTGSSTTTTTGSSCTGNCSWIGVVDGGCGSPTGFAWSGNGNTCSGSCSSPPCSTATCSTLATLIGRWPSFAGDTASLPCS